IEQSEHKQLKSIIDVLDVTPVLTDELLQLGKWIADDTLSLYITTFQAMLPQVLKAKYKKLVMLVDNNVMDESLKQYFNKYTAVEYETFINDYGHNALQKFVENGDVKIHYQVKSQETKRYETIISPVSIETLQNALKTLSKQTTRQREIIEFFIQHTKSIQQTVLYQTLDISRHQIKALIDKGLLTEEKREIYRDPYEDDIEKTKNLRLTDEQQQAIIPINQTIKDKEARTFLLHGVTGSGKTEIYLQAIEKVIAKGEEAIVLVPGIALTPQMVRRFKGRFGSQVAVMHSALSAGEKYDEWRKIQRKEVKVVVGARSAIFAPFENLGIIIIDEEHETTYKQEETPRYHARDVAIKRSEYNNCPVVFGSATPTLESFARAKKDVYHLLTLNKRTNEQPMPYIDIVDMRSELHAGNRTMFSRTLLDKIKARMDNKEQIVLLLNRRGYSTFALCRDCGHVEECPNCD